MELKRVPLTWALSACLAIAACATPADEDGAGGTGGTPGAGGTATGGHATGGSATGGSSSVGGASAGTSGPATGIAGASVAGAGGSGGRGDSAGSGGAAGAATGGSASGGSGPGGAIAGSGGGAIAGSGGGAIAGSGGGAIAGSDGGATAGSDGGAIAGSDGGAIAGSDGGAIAGSGGGAIAGSGGAATGGAGAAGSGGSGNAGRGGSGPVGGAGGSAPAPSGENDGANCTIAALPDSGALVTNAKLPDPFKKLDGTRMSTKAEWRCRREEINRLAEKFAYGTKGKPMTVTGTVSNSSITVSVSDNGKTASFSASVSMPTTGSAPYPAVIVLGGFGADSATIRAAGAAIISYDPYAVGKETGARSPKQGAYYNIAGSNSTTGLLMAWSWGVSRIIDVIEKSDGKILRANGIGVTGCSRFGKGAFTVGVFDQRVALTMPIESGSAGVPIWRGIPGEGAQSLSSAYGEQPWFGDAFGSFTSSPTKLPIDTHELVAMVAPRGLFIMDNPHIANLGPRSAHAAALAGAEVYKALGVPENITYWSDIQDGGHCNIRPEWKDPLTKNIQKYLVKTGSYTGVIKASSKATAKASDWVDWTTPTLN